VIIEDAVDGEIVEEKSPEERRAEKVEHISSFANGSTSIRTR
jgi:hypothetical protein